MKKTSLFFLNLEKILWKIIFFFLGYVLSRIKIFGEFYPFGLCLISTSRLTENTFSFLGSCLGFLTLSNGLLSFRYIFSLIIILVLNWAFEKTKFDKKILSPIIVFFSSFSMNLPFIFPQIKNSNYVMYLTESIISCIGAHIFSEGFFRLEKIIRKNKKISRNSLLYFFLMTNITMISLVKHKILNIQIFNSLLTVVTLFSLLVLKTNALSLMSVFYNTICFLTEVPYFLFLNYHLSNFILGFIKSSNKGLISVFYFLINLTIYSILRKNNFIEKSFICFGVEILIGILIFLLIPDYWILNSRAKINYGMFSDQRFTHIYLIQKIKLFSEAFKKTSRLIDKFSEIEFQKNNRTNEEVRETLKNNIDNMNDFCSDLCYRIDEDLIFDEEICSKIKMRLKSLILFSNVICRYNSVGKVLVQIVFEKSKLSETLIEEMHKQISIICGKGFAKPEVFDCENKVLARFYEKPKYNIVVQVDQKSSIQSRHCGDNFSYFFDGLGNSFALLNDGEGTGELAYVNANLINHLMKNLLRNEISSQMVFEIANSVLISSGQEITSTVDLFFLNLFTGNAKIVKAGAAPTFLYRNRKIRSIFEQTLPIGILPNVNSKIINFNLRENDSILMVSDGASSLNKKQIENIFTKFDRNKRILVREISEMALKNNLNEPDDITSICISLKV
ncbi:MAG: Stage II sporulation protein E [Candidatus Improbicoccus pseudotrichonymphae]|uniref:Stage II sporulation protein E n=1 Tax=Candidatus Improbicoccus pseudotrichonymphae TaxID=3033792 RepID=A0AA48HVC6_9FIRM|nr:MAG: Stage II sporulation protein E [Candidatus Improbicoccus pseudotrichonymphae]